MMGLIFFRFFEDVDDYKFRILLIIIDYKMINSLLCKKDKWRFYD